MYNTYITSAVFTLRTKGSLSFSQFNDYNLLADRFDNNPSSKHCCSCCNCSSSSYASSFVSRRLPSITPSLFYGLRQSTLIQLSPCKRLIFGARDRYHYWVRDYDFDHGCFEVSCSFNEKGDGKRIERRRKGRFRGLNSCERQCLTNGEDFDALISLLSDDQNGNSSKRVEMEMRSYYYGDCQQRRRKNVRLASLESQSRSRIDLVSGEFRKEDYRRKGDREDCQRKEEREECRREEERNVTAENEGRKVVLKGENRKERKASSSFSSYYSLSSTGDFESDKEAHDELVGSLEESSGQYKKGSWHGENGYGEQVVRDDFKQRTSTARTGAEWDLRKKTEKKLAEIEETKSRKESSQSLSSKAWTSEREYGKLSSSYKQSGLQNEKSSLAVNYEKGTRKQFNQKGDFAARQSQFMTDYQEITDTQEIRGNDVKLTVDADLVMETRVGYDKTNSEGIGNYNSSKNTQQFSQMLGGYDDTERVSSLEMQSESRMKIQEEERVRMSVLETSEKHQQTFQQVTGQLESRTGPQRLSKISEIQDRNSRNTSTLQAETEMKNQEGSMGTYMVKQANEQRFHVDQNAHQRIQSTKGSQDIANMSMNITSVSVVNASGKERVYDSKITSEKGVIDQESESTSLAKPIRKTEERDTPTDKRITKTKSRNEADRATEALRFEEKTSQEAFNFQASKNMTLQARIQQIDVEEEGYRSLQATTMPPSVQIVDRGSLHVNPRSRTATCEVLGQTSETSSSALYANLGGRTSTSLQKPYGRDWKGDIYGEPSKLLAPEDAMGSACRQEETSMQFVGEFLEMAKDEVSSSEIQRDKNSDQKLVEWEKDENSSQYDLGDLHLKEQNSRPLSGGSGEKGPSDEMWDVTDPSCQEPPETKAPEGNTQVSTTVIRKTGRSFWSIIADVVRLRWGSLSETSKSARRSGVKSSNDSASEAWFSGHDPEENSDKNVEREKGMSKEASFSHHMQLVNTSSQGQGEVSDAIRAKSKIRQLEVDMSSPSTAWKSGSTSKGMSSPSEEEQMVWGQGGKSSHVFPPSTEVGEPSSSPLPTSSMDAFIVEESNGRGKTDVPVSSMTEQPATSESTGLLGPEGMEGDLKRRKLQRNKQVVRDRFDEWEEAYMRESEQRKIDEMFMREALLEAKKAADTWEVPVGAVLVRHGKIIARGHNLVEELRDSTAHAEMICIREASNQLRTWRLAETTLYVTLEPCPMCAGAILQARIDTLVWGAPNKLLGADGSWIRLFPNGGGGNGAELMDKPPAPVHPFHPNITIRRGILASECADAMQQFFQLRRRKKAKSVDSSPKPSLPIASHHSKILNKMHDIFHALLCL